MRFWGQWGYTGLGYYQYHKPHRECHGARSLPGNLLAKLCNDRDFLYYADCGSVKNLVHEEYRERLNYAKNALSAPNCHNPLFGFCGQPEMRPAVCDDWRRRRDANVLSECQLDQLIHPARSNRHGSRPNPLFPLSPAASCSPRQNGLL